LARAEHLPRTPRRAPAMRCTSLLLTAVLLTAVPAAAQPPAGKDQHGDPLPDGAIARLGTLRWRHEGNVTFAALLPGGGEVLTVGLDQTIRVWDCPTGKEVRRFEKPAPKAVTGKVGPTNPFRATALTP